MTRTADDPKFRHRGASVVGSATRRSRAIIAASVSHDDLLNLSGNVLDDAANRVFLAHNGNDDRGSRKVFGLSGEPRRIRSVHLSMHARGALSVIKLLWDIRPVVPLAREVVASICPPSLGAGKFVTVIEIAPTCFQAYQLQKVTWM